MTGVVSELFLYPVKGARPVSVSAITVGASGLRDDRLFMLVGADGHFLSSRTHPKVALLQTQIVDVSSSGALLFGLTLPSGLTFALTPPPVGGATRQVVVWRDTVTAHVVTEPTSALSAYFGEPVTLVSLAQDHLRQVNPERAESGDRVGFADGYPLLLTSRASLDDLNARINSRPNGAQTGDSLTMARFRPNVVIGGFDAYAEDNAEYLSLGGLPFFSPKLCDRCVVTTIDPDTLAQGKEPLRTLASYRKWDGAVWFGTNLIPRASGTVRLGDPVEILSSRQLASKA